MTKQMRKYNVVNGTSYDAATCQKVVDILEQSRHQRSSFRLVLYYGDCKTGQAWGDIVECFVGRSCGDQVKIPLAIRSRRSLGGEGLLDACIVKILTARGKRVLYQHPTYKIGAVEFYGKNAQYA